MTNFDGSPELPSHPTAVPTDWWSHRRAQNLAHAQDIQIDATTASIDASKGEFRPPILHTHPRVGSLDQDRTPVDTPLSSSSEIALADALKTLSSESAKESLRALVMAIQAEVDASAEYDRRRSLAVAARNAEDAAKEALEDAKNGIYKAHQLYRQVISE